MKHKPIVIIVSEFNQTVTEGLLRGALQVFEKNAVNSKVIRVPGAVEIPLIAKKVAKKGSCSAIICLGAVIYGETDHYYYVAKQVSDGCQKIMLDYDLPVIFGVLTTRNLEQAIQRSADDNNNKGAESARTALRMIEILDTVYFSD